LADGLPAAVLEQIGTELRTLPRDRQRTERRKRVEAWLDAGRGSCVLRLPEAAECVLNTWRRIAGERYELIAWVVMPNHVHVLVLVYEGVPSVKIVQSWKSHTGRRIRALMEESRAGARRSRGQGVWMRDYWDRYLRDERHFQMAVDYIH